jgi:hypothetical protein
LRITRYPSRQETCGRPGAYEVRIVTSMPARPQNAAMFDACTSEPPASGSSRSRHARIDTRRKPARAAMSPSFATTSSFPASVPGTGRNLGVAHRAFVFTRASTRVAETANYARSAAKEARGQAHR